MQSLTSLAILLIIAFQVLAAIMVSYVWKKVPPKLAFQEGPVLVVPEAPSSVADAGTETAPSAGGVDVAAGPPPSIPSIPAAPSLTTSSGSQASSASQTSSSPPTTPGLPAPPSLTSTPRLPDPPALAPSGSSLPPTLVPGPGSATTASAFPNVPAAVAPPPAPPTTRVPVTSIASITASEKQEALQEQFAETQIDPTFGTESALSVQRLMQIASDLSDQRQFIDAERIYAMVQDRDPNIAEAYARRGETLEFLGRYEQAIEQWKFYQTLATSQYDRNRATRQINHIETVVKLAKLQEEIRNPGASAAASSTASSPAASSLPPANVPPARVTSAPAVGSSPTTSSNPAVTSNPASSPATASSSGASSSPRTTSVPSLASPSPTYVNESSRTMNPPYAEPPPRRETTSFQNPARPAFDNAGARRLRIVNSTRVRFAGNEKYEQKRFIELHLEADQSRGPIDLNKISIKYCFFDRDKNYPKEIRLSSAQPIQRLSFEQDYSNPAVYRINLHLPYLVAVGTRAREQRTINRYLEYHGFFVRLFYDGVEQSDGAPIIRPPNVSPGLFEAKYLRHVGANGPL